jgi:hypothetical protein
MIIHDVLDHHEVMPRWRIVNQRDNLVSLRLAEAGLTSSSRIISGWVATALPISTPSGPAGSTAGM